MFGGYAWPRSRRMSVVPDRAGSPASTLRVPMFPQFISTPRSPPAAVVLSSIWDSKNFEGFTGTICVWSSVLMLGGVVGTCKGPDTIPFGSDFQPSYQSLNAPFVGRTNVLGPQAMPSGTAI